MEQCVINIFFKQRKWYKHIGSELFNNKLKFEIKRQKGVKTETRPVFGKKIERGVKKI